MRAKEMHVAKAGPASAIKMREVDVPQPGPGEALVSIEAAGVAVADIVLRRGVYPAAKLPITPGYDFVGRIEAVGENDEGFQVGQRVAGVTIWGSYATHRLIRTDWIVPAPEEVPAELLAAASLNGVTALQMLRRCAPASKGEWILAHGAGGGVGTMLTDLAVARGIKVIGSASGGKQQVVADRGATPIDYQREDVAARAREISGGGVVAAYDHIGPSHLKKVSLPALREGGAAVLYGGYDVTRDGKLNLLAALRFFVAPSISIGRLFASSQSVVAYAINNWMKDRPGPFREDFAEAMALVGEGKLKPLIAATYPLEQAAEAHRALETRSVAGKIVLTNASR